MPWIRIRIGIQPKMLDPDPAEINADPQPWKKYLRLLLNLPANSVLASFYFWSVILLTWRYDVDKFMQRLAMLRIRKFQNRSHTSQP